MTEKSLSEFQEMNMKLKTNYCKAVIGKKYEKLPELIKEVKEAINYQFRELKQSKLQSKETVLSNIKDLLHNVIDVYKIFKFSGSEELRKDITNYIEKYEDPAFKVNFYKYLLLELFETGNFLEAIKYGCAALKTLDSQEIKINITDKQNVLYNLGRSYIQINTNEAFKYLNQAENLTSQNEHIIAEKYYINLSLKKIKEAVVEADKIKDLELKNLMLIRAYLATGQGLEKIIGKFNCEENKFKKDELKGAIYDDILSIIYNQTGNIQKFINLYEDQIDTALNQNDPKKAHIITCKALILFQNAQKWDEGLTFLDEIYKKYPTIFQNHNSSTLKYYEFLFYNNNAKYINKAEEILSSFNDQIFLTTEGLKVVAYTYEIAIYSTLLKNDFIKLSLYKKNLDKFPNNPKIKLVKELVQIFFPNPSLPTSNAEILESQVPESKLSGSIETPIIIKPKSRSFAEIEMMIAAKDNEAISQLNQKTLRKYHAYKKLELQNQIDNNTKSMSVWSIGGKIIDETQAVCLDQRSKFYGIIDENLLSDLNKLDKKVVQKFKMALDKGFVGDKGEIGVKRIPKKLIELKILENTVLYTKEIYKNPEGKYLVIFNEQGNHETVGRIAEKAKLECISLSNEYDNDYTVSVIGDY